MLKFLPFVWRMAMRQRLRTLLTAMAIATAFAIYGLLAAARAGLSFGVELAGADTLMMFQKVSLGRPLPLAYYAEIASTAGVAAVTHATWFSGKYQDQNGWFPQMAVDAPSFLAMHPGYRLTPEERRDWLLDRTACIVGRDVAARFGWKIGQRIPLQNASWRSPDDDDGPWTFTIAGIYDAGRPGTDLSQMLFHYQYLNETRIAGRDTVGWYVIRVTRSDMADEVAARLDGLFANSSHETRTTTTKAFLQSWASQIADVGALVIAVLATVFFTILLVAGTTMMQAVRERTNDFAVLKVLGYSDARLLSLVMIESVTVAVCGGAAGLAVAWIVVGGGDPTGGLLPAFYLSAADITAGAGLAAMLGIVTGALPARRAGKLRIADASRR